MGTKEGFSLGIITGAGRQRFHGIIAVAEVVTVAHVNGLYTIVIQWSKSHRSNLCEHYTLSCEHYVQWDTADK